MVRIYTGQVLALVEIMKDLLAMHGIESHVRNRYLSAGVGEIPPHESWPQLWVSERDSSRAREIVEEAEQESSESEEAVACANCGEEVPVQFATCWNCGADME